MLNGKSSQVTEQAVEIIYQRIQQNTYAVGSALPSQRELAIQLGISRASLREALTRPRRFRSIRNQSRQRCLRYFTA